MAQENVNFNLGAYQVLIDSDFLQKMDRLLLRRFRDDAEEKNRIRSEILRLRYFVDHPPKRRSDGQRASGLRHCQKILEGLRRRMARGGVEQVAMNGDLPSGAELTEARLGRCRLREVGGRDLLLEIERHPRGGDPVTLDQYWLFLHGNRRLILLSESPRMKMKTAQAEGKLLVQKGGQWGAPSVELRLEFYALVTKRLGPEFIGEFEKLLQPSPPREASTPDDVADRVRDLTGIDLREEEKERDAAIRRAAAKAGYEEPAESNMWLDPRGFAVGYAKKDDSSESKA